MLQKLKIPALGIGAVLALFLLVYEPLSYTPPATDGLPASFEQFYAARLAESEAHQARPNNEERLVRFSPGPTPFAILAIHGFGASRGEMEYTVDRIAAHFQANTYYMRLPGHGTNMDDHASVTFEDYLDSAELALAMMPKLGERIVVVGSSTGALLGTHLASRYPDRVAALIVASPLYEFRTPAAVLFYIPGAMPLAELALGEIRDASWREDPEDRLRPGYNDYWLTQQKLRATLPLSNLRRYIVNDTTFGRISSPVLMFYYYRDEDHQDQTVNVQAMLERFSQLGRLTTSNALNRAVAIEDGHHILLSQYVRTDKERILSESIEFLEDVERQAAEGE